MSCPSSQAQHLQVQQKTAVAALSVASNSVLVVGKLGVGMAIGSVSIVSEAIHSAVDLVASVIALLAVRISSTPADRDHPWGHGKVENVSGLVEALLIFVAALWVIWEAVHKLISPAPVEMPWLGVVIMGISSVVNQIVSGRLFRVARATESIALEADAWHLRSDVYTSLGVMAGLGLVWGLGAVGIQAGWLDPLIAIGVAFLILHAAYDLTRKSSADLLDARLPEGEEDVIKGCILAHAPGVVGFHQLRTRRSGAHRFVDVHIEVPGSMSTAESHYLADSVENSIRSKFGGISVTVHVDPDVQGHARDSDPVL